MFIVHRTGVVKADACFERSPFVRAKYQVL